MQNFLYLTEVPDGPTTRIINVENINTCSAHPANPEWTQLFMIGSEVTLHMKLEEFLKVFERLITENYKYGHQWHEKRMKDTEAVMLSALGKMHT